MEALPSTAANLQSMKSLTRARGREKQSRRPPRAVMADIYGGGLDRRPGRMTYGSNDVTPDA